VNYGHDFSPMIMAGLWALALACYVTGMCLAARPGNGAADHEAVSLEIWMSTRRS